VLLLLLFFLSFYSDLPAYVPGSLKFIPRRKNVNDFVFHKLSISGFIIKKCKKYCTTYVL
jgi:hypothetical protein